MARTKEPPLPTDYFGALQRILELQTSVLTASLPHSGERGRNDEARFTDFLRRALPRRFSLGTGFIVSSDPSIPPSSQTDIVLYDEFVNSPLYRELTASVFPVETVYATVEVKGLLKPSDLTKCVADVAKVRALAMAKRYLDYVPVPADPNHPEKTFLGLRELQSTLAPRAFIVAYDIQGWSSVTAFLGSWKRALSRNRNAHIHGVVVLSKNWFVYQVAHQPDEIKLKAATDHALVRLLDQLTTLVNGFEIHPTAMYRYFGVRR